MGRMYKGGSELAQMRYHATEKYRKTHREYNKNNRLQKLYGITLETKILMWEKQEGKCANKNCGRILMDPRLTTKSATNKANVDHSHATGKTRELLCTGCNASLGHCGEDRHRILGLIEYLTKFQEPSV